MELLQKFYASDYSNLKNVTKIMGLDLSLTSTGVSIGGLTTSIRSKNKGSERLLEIRNEILTLAQEAGVQIVAVEGYSYASRHSQAHSIGELGGVVRVALRELGVPVVVIPPTCRAKFATGKGNSGKSEVMSAISAKTGIIWSGGDGNDRCDAWILEQMTLTYLGLSQYEWNSDQVLALKKCDFTAITGEQHG
jgi:Holliday junction resolvasome RuvABC endonuclease subunit